MLFNFDGREFDTNKPIYMLGYDLSYRWFPVDLTQHKIYYYKLSCKKLFVKTLHFEDLNNKDNSGGVTSVEFWAGRNNFCYFPYTNKGTIIGRSVKECMKLFKERGGEICESIK